MESQNARKYEYPEEAPRSNDVRKLIPTFSRLSSACLAALQNRWLEFLIPKKSWTGITSNQNGTTRLAKVSHGTSQNILWGNAPMNLQKHLVWKEVEQSDETWGQAYDFWLCFIKSRLTTLLKNHQQISGEKNIENHCEGLPKWSRKGT